MRRAASPALLRLELLDGTLEQQRVHESLWEVASQLVLRDVELLRVQRRRPAGGTGALEPAGGKDVVALLGVGERHPEAAQQKRAFRRAERTLVGPIAVAVSVLREL